MGKKGGNLYYESLGGGQDPEVFPVSACGIPRILFEPDAHRKKIVVEIELHVVEPAEIGRGSGEIAAVGKRFVIHIGFMTVPLPWTAEILWVATMLLAKLFQGLDEAGKLLIRPLGHPLHIGLEPLAEAHPYGYPGNESQSEKTPYPS